MFASAAGFCQNPLAKLFSDLSYETRDFAPRVCFDGATWRDAESFITSGGLSCVLFYLCYTFRGMS